MSISRKMEVSFLKEEIKRLTKELGVSKGLFKRTLPKVKGSGYKYSTDETGHKQSLRQQYLFLQELIKYKNEKKENGETNAQ